MRCMLQAALACLALLLGSVLHGAFAAVPAPVALPGSQSRLDAHELATEWIDPGGTVGFEQMLQRGGAGFVSPGPSDHIHFLGESGHLWLHWRLVRQRDEDAELVLVFPMPTLDAVTVYQQDSHGRWVAHTGGDLSAVTSWPEPGRYPHFRLNLPAGQVRDVYARIENLTPANFPAQLLSEAAYDEAIQLEYLGLGLSFGALLLLIVACVAQSLVYRDTVYGWYAAYAVVSTLWLATYTGVAPHLLWSRVALGDAPQGMLGLLAGGAVLLFTRNLIDISGRYRWLDQAMRMAGFSGIALAVIYPFMARIPALVMLGAYVTAATFVNLWVAFAAWRRGDEVAAWAMGAFAPLCLAVVLTVMRLYGWLPVSFGTQYAIVVAMAIEVPLLLVALTLRSRERHGAQIRELALSTQDALTGLLAAHLFHDRLRQVVARYKRGGGNAAIVFIDLVNYPGIKTQFGTAVAEQSLLRCVIKLRRLLRDADTVSRVGEARFGLILEGDVSRASVTERAARLIAAGLMPLKGLKPEVTLHFHIASVLIKERIAEPEALVEALDELLGGMSTRTRRPIRFLEPEMTRPSALDPDSAIMSGDSGPPSSSPSSSPDAAASELSVRTASAP